MSKYKIWAQCTNCWAAPTKTDIKKGATPASVTCDNCGCLGYMLAIPEPQTKTPNYVIPIK